MLRDFGLKNFENMEQVKNKIEEIDQSFNLILIVEQFSESMVLLNNHLCWDMDDVTYVHNNIKDKSFKSNISTEARSFLKDWLHADYMLYDHFLKKFNSAVIAYGRDKMERDVLELETKNSLILEKCAIMQVDNRFLRGQDRLHGNHMIGLKAKNTSLCCDMYSTAEIPLINLVKKIQIERTCNILKSEEKPCRLSNIN